MSGQRAAFRRKQTAMRWVVITVAMTFFALPLLGMLDFTTQGPGGTGRSGKTWRTLLDLNTITADYPTLREGFIASIGLAVLTVVVMLLLLVPTMTWVRLRVPGMSRTVEFICLLPLTVPAIVLVVGLTPIYAWFYYLLGSSTIWLGLAYVVLVLPYAYRSIDAGLRSIDVTTLAEAARSLGAGWFTIASLFSKKNLQVAMYEIGKSDAKMSVAVGLASLVFAFLVLFAMSFVGSRPPGTSALARLRRRPPSPTEEPTP